MRLLICDDHKALLEALSMALTQRGHTVVATALDPNDAVAAASEHQPDACLLDVNFPHANGLSAIARIHEVSGHTKVVILSASSDRGLVAAAMAQGAHGFIGKEKPLDAIDAALETVPRPGIQGAVGSPRSAQCSSQAVTTPRGFPFAPARARWPRRGP